MIKQSQKTRKVTIIAAFRKSSGTIKAQVENDEHLKYFVTISQHGTMCKRWDGKECTGHHFTGHCYHVSAIQQIAHLLGEEGIDTDALAAENDASYRQAVDALCDESYKQLAQAKREWAEQWSPLVGVSVGKLLSMSNADAQHTVEAYCEKSDAELRKQVEQDADRTAYNYYLMSINAA